MPQAPSPNMGIIWPTDHNDADAWDVVMDTAIRSTVDSHDHTAGKGVPIPTTALKIDADISWSFGGLSRAITDLRAIDFAPQAAAGMTALAGALFLNSADNELYYRTFGGVNVKLTAGAALNVAGFTGGIGGDYAAAGALVVFDDATDSYWFQQQVGAAVRQYARMRSADVDLYEFKANPAAGVPTNRVRLASPTALAASYALTMPTALPSVSSTVLMSNSGQLSTGGAMSAAGTLTRTFSAALVSPGATGGINSGGTFLLDVSTGLNGFPIIMNVGEVITGWTLFLNKLSAAGTISTSLNDNPPNGVSVNIGVPQSNGAVSPGLITLGQSGLSAVVTSGHSYFVAIFGGGTTGDRVYTLQVTYT